MPGAPNVAVVIVTYKRQELLGVLLDSIATLTVPPAHVVIVDNEASTETAALANSLADRLTATGVHYVPMETNTGGAGGFSQGVDTAYRLGAEWLWLMDDDVKVFPQSLERLTPWLADAVAKDTRVIQVSRLNFDGSNFYWQYDFRTGLGIPNPIAPPAFAAKETSREINTMCFEGGLVHRSIVEKIGLPDARFFIYSDDSAYGYLASKQTHPILINETLMQRTRTLDNLKIGKIRRLNSTSDMTRYYIMRNRGYLARYFQLYGDHKPLLFGLGTALTMAKETIRLVLAKDRRVGFRALVTGVRDGRTLRTDKTWRPMAELTS